MNYVSLFWKIFGITTLVSIVAYYGIPDSKDYFLEEDNLIENISALLYFVAFLYGFFLSAKNLRKQRSLIAISGVSLLGFLEEMSFGERLFNLNMPFVGDVKIDGFHDWLDVLYRLLTRPEETFPAYAPFFLLTSIAIAIALLFKFRFQIKRLIRSAQSKSSSALVLIFIWLIASSLFIDLEMIGGSAIIALEELFEMQAAIALLICCFSLQKESRASNS